MSIGKRLLNVRVKKGYSQSEFSNILGISQQNLSNYENDKRNIPDKVKIKLQQIDVNISWLLTGEGNMFINRLKSYPIRAKNLARVDKESNLSEQSDIQSSLEELVKQTTAPRFKESEERIAKLERLARKDDITLAEEIRDPEVLYVAEPKIQYRTWSEDEQTEDLPLAENLAAGVPIEACYDYETYPVPVKFLKKNKRYCVAKINGTSMIDAGIANGSYVLLEYTYRPIDGDMMVVTNDGYTTLKRLHQDKAGAWELLYEDGTGRSIKLIEGEWEVKGRFVRVL